MGGNETNIRASIRLSDTLDSVFLLSDREQYPALLRALRDRFEVSGRSLTRSAEGIRVPAMLVERLNELKPGIEMKWSPDARRFIDNRSYVKSVHATVYEKLARIKKEGVKLAEQLIQDSSGLGVLDQHQIVNVAAMALPQSPGLCLFDEQGVGKTVSFLFAFDLLVERDEVDLAIIFAPKSMIGEWPEDLRQFRPGMYRTIVLSGTTIQKRQLLSQRADVLITNFETAVTMENELRAIMRTRPDRVVLAIDESFFVKSLDAKRTRSLRRLREWAGRAYVLCGTPAPNSPLDLVQQFNLVDFGYCFHDVEVPDERELALTVVQSAIEKRGLYLRHLKNQVLPDLPPKRFQRVIIPLAAEQAQLYRLRLEQLVSDLEAVDDVIFNRQRKSFLARRTALLQICSNPSGVIQPYSEVPAKLAVLDSIVEQLVNQDGEKVVIWSFYTASLVEITNRFDSYGVVRYDGSVKSVEARREAVRRFQEDDDTMIFVANPAAAGAGLTLHRARVAIYESLSNQAAHYMQSLDRIHRRGQEQSVEYVILLCENTLELNEYARLVHKEETSRELLGDSFDAPFTRETLLADLQDAAAWLHGKETNQEQKN